MFRMRLKITGGKKKKLKHPTKASTRNLLKKFLKQADEQSRAPFFQHRPFHAKRMTTFGVAAAQKKGAAEAKQVAEAV